MGKNVVGRKDPTPADEACGNFTPSSSLPKKILSIKKKDNLKIPSDPYTLCIWACITDVQPERKSKPNISKRESDV